MPQRLLLLLLASWLLRLHPACAQLPTSLSWQTVSPLGFARYEAQGGVIGGRLWVLGGFWNDAAQTANQAHVYDPATDIWTPLREMPTRLTHSGTAVDGDSVLYLAGGFVGDHPGPMTDQVWHYDLLRDRWKPMPPLPAPRGAGMVVCYQRVLHFFGGALRQGGTFSEDRGDHWTFDLTVTNPTWQARAPMPNPRNHLGGGELDGKIYAIGGQHLHDEDHGNQASVHAYDPVSDTWRTCAPLPVPIGHITASVFPWQGYLLVAGGVSDHSTRLNTLFAYDPALDQWTELPAMPGGRQSPVIGVWGDVLLANGGMTPAGVVSPETWRVTLPAAPAIATGPELAVLPNPSSGSQLGIRIDSPYRGPVDLLLFDALGRRISQTRIDKLSRFVQQPLTPATPLAPGVYVVQLRQAGRQTALRVAVTR
jgi:N-acetylneuraminic acid mutarotase